MMRWALAPFKEKFFLHGNLMKKPFKTARSSFLNSFQM